MLKVAFCTGPILPGSLLYVFSIVTSSGDISSLPRNFRGQVQNIDQTPCCTDKCVNTNTDESPGLNANHSRALLFRHSIWKIHLRSNSSGFCFHLPSAVHTSGKRPITMSAATSVLKRLETICLEKFPFSKSFPIAGLSFRVQPVFADIF